MLHGRRPVVPLRQDPFLNKLPAAGPVELPHMLHSDPTCSTHQEQEYSDMEQTHSTLSYGDFLSQRSLSIGPTSPAWMITIAAGPAFEEGRYLQFNCNGIQHCHAELQDFLHHHQVLVACVQETKLCMNTTLEEFTGYTTIRRNCAA